MKKAVFLLALSLTFLGACGQGNSTNDPVAEEEPKMLEVDLTGPEKVNLDEEVTFKATVTHGDEKVDDADDVQFEVWESEKKEESEMIDAKHEGEGVYSITKAFSEEGMYTIQSHVTARKSHNMPKMNVVVGNVKAVEHSPVDEQHAQESDHHQGAAISLNPTSAIKEEETTLSVTVEVNEQPLKQADVRFEIWKEGATKHDWVNTTEQEDTPTYDAPYIFTEAGTYHVQVHVENDQGLHEHTTINIDVK
ncbi:FixH family protein [Metabacillus iocasae]|uniref:YtkA-like domain-containing protein n=1 Tax=Priestia iocasae TaxID=2291674 RepID=A0ABS2QWP3_9BACI|nr:FixH family protein [Metabacillus iocasae]MBM7703832.1 hypothetical protein [Metabacillus iocasae]